MDALHAGALGGESVAMQLLDEGLACGLALAANCDEVIACERAAEPRGRSWIEAGGGESPICGC